MVRRRQFSRGPAPQSGLLQRGKPSGTTPSISLLPGTKTFAASNESSSTRPKSTGPDAVRPHALAVAPAAGSSCDGRGSAMVFTNRRRHEAGYAKPYHLRCFRPTVHGRHRRGDRRLRRARRIVDFGHPRKSVKKSSRLPDRLDICGANFAVTSNQW